MNMKKLSAAVLSLMMLTACGASQNTAPAETAPETTAATTPAPVVEKDENGNMRVDFENGMAKCFMASGVWSNGSMFNCTWRSENVTFNDGKMQLTITEDKAPKDGIPYAAGEYRSKDFYGYGKYEVCMKSIKNDGVVSSFFTYTGPSDDNPWDEIDVEILGKDPTKVQFNYFTNGKGGHEFMYDLGFDSSEDFHTYGFDWQENSITWYVDGKEVYTADKDIPVTPSKIMMNAWDGIGVDGWLNKFDDSKLPLTAEYKYVSFTPSEQ